MSTTKATSKAEIMKKALVKHDDGSWHYWGSNATLEIHRNWQPIPGYPHKYVYWVWKTFTNEKLAHGTGDTLEWICDATKGYFFTPEALEAQRHAAIGGAK